MAIPVALMLLDAVGRRKERGASAVAGEDDGAEGQGDGGGGTQAGRAGHLERRGELGRGRGRRDGASLFFQHSVLAVPGEPGSPGVGSRDGGGIQLKGMGNKTG